MVKTGKRRSRDEWLEQALTVLSRDGESELRIDSLVRHLGVTKGSFYWHFKDRADFVQSLGDFWFKSRTARVPEQIALLPDDPKLRLRALVEFILQDNLNHEDLAMRAWATHHAGIAKFVRRVDQIRLKTVHGLFRDLGFDDEEASLRTRIFVTFFSLERGLSVRQSKKQRVAQFEKCLCFLTRP